MKVIITGANGFVGRNLAERLSTAHQVLAASRQTLNLLDEAAVKQYVSLHQPDAIIHTATTGGYGKSATNVLEQELRMFFNIERSIDNNIMLINCGSGAEYDRRYWQRKMSEDYFDQHVPVDEYGYGKYLIAKAIDNSKKKIVNLRIFGLFGKYESCYYKFISNAILKNLLGCPLVIQRNTRFDYLFIDDFCAVVAKILAKAPVHKQYNVTPDDSVELVDITKKIIKLTGQKNDVTIVNNDFSREYSGNNSRVKKEYSIKFSNFDDGLIALIEYYKSIIKTIDVDKIREDDYLEKMKKIS
ncbi:MAG: NAD(P)-dependent oxidoreductase [Negativicutes bacterium]|jgi:GDP-L-fucose synthase